jgi:hypothetical protein
MSASFADAVAYVGWPKGEPGAFAYQSEVETIVATQNKPTPKPKLRISYYPP